MNKRHNIMRTATALLLTAAALVALSGCNRPKTQTMADRVRSGELTAGVAAASGSQAASVTAAAGGSGAASAGSGAGSTSSGGSSSTKLTTKDASSLDAELSAIQSELDRLSLPSDSDFDSIGSGLQ